MSEFKKVSKVLLESNGIYFIECPGCKTLHPFHSDCHHGLAGQTVDLPDVEEF